MMITTGMSDEASALAEQYLAAVRAAAHRVPGDERVELLTDLREHLREAYDQEAEARRGTDWQSGGRDVPVVGRFSTTSARLARS